MTTIKRNARFNYILCIYLAGIVFFTLFRLIETMAYCTTTEGPDDFGGLYWKALWMGFRFDTTVSTYLLVVPLVLMIIGEMGRIRKKAYYAVVHYLLMVLYTVALFACAADIPYFCYFFSRLDTVALTLAGDGIGMTISMIFTEPLYVMYLGVFLAAAAGWWILGRFIYRRVLLAHLEESLSYAWSIPMAVLILAAGFVGMRGRVSKKSPIRVGTAYFCGNPFLNQIGLNPVFTFFKSIEDSGKNANKPVTLTDEATAAAVLQEHLAMPVDSTLAEASLRLPEGMNVVLVLMESMTVDKTGIYDPATSLTPNLDSLMRRSMTFTDVWSAGIHTHNGIYSTLYGHPAIMARQILKNTPMPIMCGLPQHLRDAGYSTTYLMTHDEDYDNMRGFLFQNGFERVVGEHSYPKHEILGTWGVPDHVLFNHVIEHCDSVAGNGPFFVCAMTCSDHGPYTVPDGIDFTSKNTDKLKRIVEYADWSIGRFMQMASSRKWYRNTLFVFIADHGSSMHSIYDMTLAYNHVPLIFHAPGQIEPHFVNRLGMQLDVAPTVLGLLGIDAGDKMLGVNLMNHRRPYAYFSADDRIGVVDGELFYLYRANQEGRESLYRYTQRDTEDLIGKYPERAAAMRRHAFGMIQTSQKMLLDGSTNCDKK